MEFNDLCLSKSKSKAPRKRIFMHHSLEASCRKKGGEDQRGLKCHSMTFRVQRTLEKTCLFSLQIMAWLWISLDRLRLRSNLELQIFSLQHKMPRVNKQSQKRNLIKDSWMEMLTSAESVSSMVDLFAVTIAQQHSMLSVLGTNPKSSAQEENGSVISARFQNMALHLL